METQQPFIQNRVPERQGNPQEVLYYPAFKVAHPRNQTPKAADMPPIRKAGLEPHLDSMTESTVTPRE